MELTTIHQRALGTPGWATSSIGLGCMGLSQGYGPADDDESVRLIVRSLEVGMTLLDTAMSYGQGHNERLVARALAEAGSLASTAQIATKFGIVRGPDGVTLDGDPAHVRGYLEASLDRLGRDHVDLYYLHRVDPRVPIAETVGAMAELVGEGLVGHLGVSEVTAAQLAEAHAVHPITAVQLEWSLMWRDPELDVIPTARRLGVGIVPYSPLGRGLLTDTLDAKSVDSSDFRASDPRFHGDHLDRNLAQIAALTALAAERGVTTGQLALAWLLATGPDVVPIPGTRRLHRLEENAGAAAVDLGPADLARLDEALPPTGWSGDRKSFAVPSTVRRTS